MFLEDIEVTHSGLYELRAEQLPRVGPLFSIRGEDAMTKEVLPVPQKILSFPLPLVNDTAASDLASYPYIIIELSGKYRLKPVEVSEISKCRRTLSGIL